MSQWLQLGSGLSALAASLLVAFRVWSAAPPPVTSPAIYAPVAPIVRPGEVYESESPANGFILVIESLPDGVEVVIDGESKGETPVSLNFECVPPKTFAVKLKKAGHVTIERTVPCKQNVMLVLKARPEAQRHR